MGKHDKPMDPELGTAAQPWIGSLEIGPQGVNRPLGLRRGSGSGSSRPALSRLQLLPGSGAPVIVPGPGLYLWQEDAIGADDEEVDVAHGPAVGQHRFEGMVQSQPR